MQTVKTTIVVVLLLTVTYSAYVALTAPSAKLPDELVPIVENDSLDFDLGDDIDIGMPTPQGGDMAVGTTPPPDFSLEDSLPPTLDSQAGSGDSSGLPPSMQFDPQEYAAAGPGAGSSRRSRPIAPSFCVHP